jgi:hypothetical protein
MHGGQLRIPVRCKFCRFDQYGLEMLVALLGDGAAALFASGFALGAAQTAITHRLANRIEPLRLPDL